jgi:hypothetical protein
MPLLMTEWALLAIFHLRLSIPLCDTYPYFILYAEKAMDKH